MKLNFRRFLAMFLSIVMVAGMLPAAVFAEDGVETQSETYVAEVKGVRYESLDAALAAAQAGDTIVLLANQTFSGQNAADKLSGYVIDLNDKTITLSGNTYLTGETTIKNGNIVVSGFVSDSYLCLYTADTKLTLDDVSLTGTMDCYAVLNAATGSTLIIKNSTIDVIGNVTNSDAMGNIIYGGNVTVDNSIIKGVDTVRGIGFSNITIQNGSTVNISDVETGLNCATVTVDNSTVTITNATKRAVRLNNNTLTLQNGATLTATGCAEDIIGIGTTDVVSVSSDSTLNAKDNVTPAGPVKVTTYEELIAALEKDNANVIMMNDITATATQASSYGKAGIVLGAGDVLDGNNFTLTINGANSTWDCAIAMTGGEVKNLTIAGAMRGVFMPGANGDVVIDNCEFKNVVYTFNSDGGSKEHSVTIKNTTLNGWTSFSNVHESVTFEKCTFGEGSGYAFCRPYQETTFVNCDFAEGFVIDTSCTADNTLAFNDCKYNSEALSAKNGADLFRHTGKVMVDGVSVNYSPTTYNVSTKAELKAALYAAQDGDTIVLTADIDYGTDHVTDNDTVSTWGITKAITLDLGGHTLTTHARNFGLALRNDGVIVTNGKLNHVGTVAAIKVWDAAEISDLEINVTGTSSSGNTIDGIVIQENAAGVDIIKNVKIYSASGQGVDSGIKTHNCGNATEPVIGSMVNVNVDAKTNALNISAPVGTATGCTFKGGTNGIEIWIKGTYSATLDLVSCNVEGGVFAHDEFSSDPSIVNNGKLKLTADTATTGASEDAITLTIARAEKVEGILKNVMDNAQAKVNDTYYATLAEAVAEIGSGDVVIDLLADATLDITAWQNLPIGGDTTTSITINGNGKTLTFNHLNSDWNNVATNNNAKLILNNMKITNSGYNNGPWNRHDINFACDVELHNVTSDKALAFKAGATLDTVTISDANTSDTYAIWIQPNGQTVTITNSTIDMLACSDGRGIKIDNQYRNEGQDDKVTLNVSNTSFKTEEKAAIMVKSVVGADIALTNVNISGVAADTVNAVWNDEDTADYLDKITVKGGTVKQEGATPVYVAQIEGGASFTSLEDAVAAAQAGDTVVLLADVTLGEKLTISGNVTISGAHTITRDAAYTGTLFEVVAGAALTMDDGLTIDGGNAWNYTKTPLEMDMANGAGTYVANHITPAEGGVNATAGLIVNKGTLNANKVTIENCYSTNDVSVIDCGANSVTTLDGALMQNIAANRSGAVLYVGGADAVLTIKGATRITGNFGIGNGGIIQNYGQGTTVNMEGGRIDNNHIGKSGTLYATYSGNAEKINTFNMSGGIITKNIMEGYGPIYIHTNSSWNMTGGEISNNISFLPSYVRSKNNTGNISGGKIVNNEITGTSYNSGYYVNRQDIYLGENSQITGGTFTQDVTEYLAPGFRMEKNADGTYGVAVDPAYGMVAKIGNTYYKTIAKAIDAAQPGETITLIWAEGDAPIAMNGAVYGKTVTITGTAIVDWSKDNLFVGRGGEGNGTVIFDNANLTSASNSSSYGIHVSGREKDTDNKYDGTLIIKNSTIELDYLINRGTINVDNSTLTVKNGFGIAGRPASETESGKAATATVNITNSSYVTVLNHNGMGVGVAAANNEGYGVLNLTDSTFECASFNINGDKLGSETLGDFNVYGKSTLKINTLTGREIDLHHNAIIKDSTVGGEVMLYGKVTFRGANTFAMLCDYGAAYSTDSAEWLVEKDASVTLTDKARYGLGYGDKVVIYGDLTNALTARETLTDDDIVVFMHGLVAMSSWNVENSFEVNNAYVVIGSNNSFGNTSKDGYTGKYTFAFNNSVVDFSRVTFYNSASTTELIFNKSDVRVGQFMNRDADSVFYLINSKVLSTSDINGTDEGNYLAGMLVLNNSSLSYVAPLKMEDGTLTLGAGSSLTADSIIGTGKIIIDATGMTAGKVEAISANASGFTGTIEVINNDKLTAAIDDNGNIVLVAKEAELFDIAKTNMIMGQNLALMFAFEKSNIADADLSGYVAKVSIAYKDDRGTVNSEIVSSNWTTVTIGGVDYWCVTVSNLAAKEMDDDVTVTIYKGEEAISKAKTMSLRQYGEERLAASTDNLFKTTVVDMLNYGAEAQKYFEYNENNLANRNISAYQNLATTTVTLDKTRNIISDENNHFIASNVTFTSDIAMLFAIARESTAVSGKITFVNHKNGTVTTFVDSYEEIIANGKAAKKFVFTGMVVADIDQVISVEFYDAEGNVVISLTDSLDAYLGRVGSTSRMKALADAFGKFSTSAYAYLHK